MRMSARRKGLPTVRTYKVSLKMTDPLVRHLGMRNLPLTPSAGVANVPCIYLPKRGDVVVACFSRDRCLQKEAVFSSSYGLPDVQVFVHA